MVAEFFSMSATCCAADYRNLPLNNALLDSGITIVDIRTEPEWRETGIVPGTVLLTFFRADRSYNMADFVAELARYASPQEEIALLCRNGNRSAKLAHLLAQHGYRSIINVSGGIRSAAGNGVLLVPYPATP
ncbi:MAG: rhodanese-like domain-containing protein [Syntrophotaleaceae bacterium]